MPCAAAIWGSVSPVTEVADSWFRLCANSTAASQPWFVGLPFASNVSSSSGAVSSRTRCSIWLAVRLPPLESSQAGMSVPARPQMSVRRMRSWFWERASGSWLRKAALFSVRPTPPSPRMPWQVRQLFA